MREEYIVALAMLAVLVIGEIITKNNKKWLAFFLLAASVAGSLAAGMGVRFREIVEGPFGFLDAALSVAAASVFTGLLCRGGFFEALEGRILKIKGRGLRALCQLLFIALPGMFTGLASLSVMTTGKIAKEQMKKAGLSDQVIARHVMAGAFFGMMLPPNCLPAIIASNGAGSVLPTPYVGFFVPLLVMTLPAFILYALLNQKTLAAEKTGEADETEAVKLPAFEGIIFAIVCVGLLIEGFLSSFVYIGGNTLLFFAASLLLVFRKNTGLDAAVESLFDAVPPLAALLALGSFIEVSSMTGVRGIFSLIILPQTTGDQTWLVMLVLMALAILLGLFLSTPLPGFLVAYAVFPIGWLANPVIVTGISAAAGLAYLISIRGGLFEETEKTLALKETKWGASLKSLAPYALLTLALAVIMVLFGDSLSFLVL